MTRRVTKPVALAILASAHGISDAAREQIEKYLELLQKWGARINLTGTTARQELLDFHINDCLHLLPHLPDGSLVDVGAGAGLPSVVLACCQPQRSITAVEPTNKKVAFLRTVKRELGLDKFEVRCTRVENIDDHRFDIAVSRATWSVDKWFERAARLVVPGGLIVGMEGRERFHLDGVERHSYTLGDRQRAIVLKRLDTSAEPG